MEEKQSVEKPEKIDIDILAGKVFDLLEEKKAEDIKLMSLREVNSYFNYFLLATASSQMHLKSLVRDVIKSYGDYLPAGQKGIRSDDVESGWVVVDFIELVVHVFVKDEREFYNLERLWGDAPVVRQSSDGSGAGSEEGSGS